MSHSPLALITGASSGIGLATLEFFVEKGWSVIAVSRGIEKLARVETQFGKSVMPFSCDLSNSDQVLKLVSTLKAKGLVEQIRTLVNNAGIYERKTFLESDDHVWESQLNTNLMGSVRITRELLKAAMSLNSKFDVVNISSTLGRRPIAATAAYSASKAAMISWTQALALELAELGVRVNCICPGIVDTPIHPFHEANTKDSLAMREFANTLQPLKKIGEPRDIAAGVYYLSSDEAKWITGTILNIDGGISLQ